MLDIFPFPALIQLEDFLGGIQHCVTVVGNWIFDSNFPFAILFTNKIIWNTVELTIMKKRNELLQRSIESHEVLPNREKYKLPSEVKIHR